MMCEFWNGDGCMAKDIVKKYGNSSHRVSRLRKGYKEQYCKTKSFMFCFRRFILHQIIQHGDYEG